jgi:hypothetical protein
VWKVTAIEKAQLQIAMESQLDSFDSIFICQQAFNLPSLHSDIVQTKFPSSSYHWLIDSFRRFSFSSFGGSQ